MHTDRDTHRERQKDRHSLKDKGKDGGAHLPNIVMGAQDTEARETISVTEGIGELMSYED